jgi:hypothetical protein
VSTKPSARNKSASPPANRPSDAALTPLAATVDAAIAQGPAARAQLDPQHQGEYDLILQAFAQLASGELEQARETVQPIGLTSPLLDWKLLVRGLAAFYAHDDARAIENWQRLHPQRLPARLAAPFRSRIDPAFRQTLSPSTSQQLRAVAMRLAGVTICEKLSANLGELNSKQGITKALKSLEKLWPQLREQMPQHLPRLARLFYAAIIHTGRASDIPLYAKWFGAPPDDPGLQRLSALEAELSGRFADTARAWQAYLQQIEQLSHRSDEEKRMAQSLIWERLAVNAQTFLDQTTRDPAFALQALATTSQPHWLPPVECWKRSAKAMPSRRKPTLEYLRLANPDTDPDYEPIAQEFLNFEPDNATVLTILAQRAKARGEHQRWLDLAQRAFAAQPGNARLARQLQAAICNLARHQAIKKQPIQALATLSLATQLQLPADVVTLVLQSLLTQRLGQHAESAAALAQAAALPEGTPLALAVVRLAEATILKAPPTLKKQLQDELTRALAQPLELRAGPFLAAYLAEQAAAPKPFVGYTNLRRRVAGLLEQACPQPMSDPLAATQLAVSVLRLRLTRYSVWLGLWLERLTPNHPAVPLLTLITITGNLREANATSLLASARNRLAQYANQPLHAELAEILDALTTEQELANRRHQNS